MPTTVLVGPFTASRNLHSPHFQRKIRITKWHFVGSGASQCCTRAWTGPRVNRGPGPGTLFTCPSHRLPSAADPVQVSIPIAKTIEIHQVCASRVTTARVSGDTLRDGTSKPTLVFLTFWLHGVTSSLGHS